MIDARKFFAKVCMLVFLLTALPAALMAQVQVTGTVVDAQNEPIIGATVIEKGNAKNAAISDIEGNFKLKVAAGKKIVVSYVGMVTQEVAAGEGLKIVMQDDASTMEEVVVVGYTSKARKDLTGSVGSVSGAKLAAVPVASAAEALAGKIAGVQVTTVDGQPGADINIRVRGATSVTQSNDPLYIVDGFQQSNINDIPPSDIASIDVLKDASLTAIYGAKGGNGVIVVTTKSAQAGKVQVSFNGRLTVAHLSKKLDLMDNQDFAEYTWDRAASSGTRSDYTRYWRNNFGHQSDIDLYATLPSHDWQDEVMGETPINYSANVTIGGGNDKTKFNVSATQTEDKGIIMGSGVRRTNINIKINTWLAKNLQLAYNPTMTYRRDEGAGGDNIGSGGIIDVLKYRPTNGMRDYGQWNAEWVDEASEKNFEYTNPVNDIATNVQKKHQYNINNKASLTWTPIEGLTLRTEGNFSITFRDTNRFYGSQTSTGKSNNSQPVAEITNRTQQSYTWTNTANYNLTLQDVHNFSFLLGQEIYNSQYKETYMKNRYFPDGVSAQTAFDNMNLGKPWEATSELSTADRTASFFGQVSYNYDHKYLFSATMRADGSSKFAPGNQWGYFPSVSAAWDLKREEFLKDVKWIQQLKLRGAFGLAGNNRISSDLFRYLYSVSTSGGPGFGETTELGESYYSASSYPNKNIKWETTITRNIAADITLFGGRLTVTPEVYFNTTRDLLYSATIAGVTGFTKQMQNIGKVTNNGWELTVNGDILRGKDYVLSGNFTLGKNKMTIKELGSADGTLTTYNSRFYSSAKDDYQYKVGSEIGLIYGYVYDGLYTMDEFNIDKGQNFLAVSKEGSEAYSLLPGKGTVATSTDVLGSSNSGVPTLPGKIKFKDLDGDGQITSADRTIIGNTNPKVQGGFGLSGQYKDFDFTANFTYMIGFDVYNGTAYALSSATGDRKTSFTNVLSKFTRDNRWTYTLTEGNRECMYKNYYIDGAGDITYPEMNEGKTLWNPGDLVTNTINSYFVENGSFVRLSDVTIGYTLPKNLTKKIGISKLRVYASGSNLFIITNYSGYDPEVDIQSGLTPSMDYNRYPRNRAFSLGVNLTF